MCDASAWASNTLLDRAGALERFTANRRRTRALFDLLDESAYYERPIRSAIRSSFTRDDIPAFGQHAIKKALGRPGVDDHLETIFARGIDPESEAMSIARGNPAWPSRAEVRQYVEAADRLIEQAIERADLERPGDPLLDHGRALWTILEHEEMHQETLGYIWHQLPYSQKRKPSGYHTVPLSSPHAAPSLHARIRSGFATLGTDLREDVFAWDNECPLHRVHVNEFSVDVYNVTNGQFMEFVQAGGYRAPQWWRPEDWAWIESAQVSHPSFWEHDSDRWFWRGMFERVPLPETWPSTSPGQRRRLRTLAQVSSSNRGGVSTRGVQYARRTRAQLPMGRDRRQSSARQLRFHALGSRAGGAHPEGASAFGVHDLIGNGWEWTSTPFGPFDGFEPLPTYPEYSADFFDGDHFVMKGASPLTARTLVTAWIP